MLPGHLPIEFFEGILQLYKYDYYFPMFAELQVKFAVVLLRNASMRAEPKLKKRDLKYYLCT